MLRDYGADGYVPCFTILRTFKYSFSCVCNCNGSFAQTNIVLLTIDPLCGWMNPRVASVYDRNLVLIFLRF